LGKGIQIVGGALLLAGLGVAGAYLYRTTWGRPAEGRKTVVVQQGTLTQKAQAVGEIQPKKKFQVKSKIPGIVKRCFVEVGDPVKAGDALFEIGPDPTPMERTDADRSIERTRATFEKARAKYQRYQELKKAGIVAAQDLEEAEEAYELAKTALTQARDNRDFTLKGKVEGEGVGLESIIRAPASGTVLTRAVNEGDPVVPLTSFQPGTEMAVVADLSELLFRGTVDEIDVGKISLGLTARIKVGAQPDGGLTGKLSRIAPQSRINKDGATIFDVEVSLDPFPAGSLRAGYSCNASIITQEKTDVLLLPERVVIRGKDKERNKGTVDIPGPAPKAPPKKLEIALGLSDGMNVEVVSGLKKGDKVLEPEMKEKEKK
jgi:HlyD family secretion protein